MAYKMTEITDCVRVGINREGEFHIEIWDLRRQDPRAECKQVFIPANAASDLGRFLMLHG